jgi:starch synthase
MRALVKTGGLADVAGRPARRAGPARRRDARTPAGLPGVMAPCKRAEAVAPGTTSSAGRRAPVGEGGGARDLLVLDAPHLFDRDGTPYLGPDRADWPDNPERFAALSWMAARWRPRVRDGWRPTSCMAMTGRPVSRPTTSRHFGGDRAPVVLTIHNIAFHGLAPAAKLDRAAPGCPADFTPGRVRVLGADQCAQGRARLGRPDHDRLAHLCAELTRPSSAWVSTG